MDSNTNIQQPNQIQTLFRYDTEFGADSVEWCPHMPYQTFFVCGNYQLQEAKDEQTMQKRLGCILLFSISSKTGLTLHQQLDTAGILDLKWCPNKINGISLLGSVNSDGKIEIFKFKNEKISFLASYTFINEKEPLILSLDWSTSKYDSDEPFVVCSDSVGAIHLLCFSNNQLIVQNSWSGHGFQAWIAAFYYWDCNIFFSGGDDSLFLMFDKRVESIPIKKNKKHEAGVTSLHSNKSREHIIVTGSYDEYIRLWDIRNMKKCVVSVKMPGTLWRLKWDPFIQKYLLAACMYGGVHIVDAEKEEMQIVQSYYEHKNISYGADWCYLQNSEVDELNYIGNVVIGTCSFYDKLLCVSKTSCNFSF